MMKVRECPSKTTLKSTVITTHLLSSVCLSVLFAWLTSLVPREIDETPSVCLPVCLSVCLSVCLPACLSVGGREGGSVGFSQFGHLLVFPDL